MSTGLSFLTLRRMQALSARDVGMYQGVGLIFEYYNYTTPLKNPIKNESANLTNSIPR